MNVDFPRKWGFPRKINYFETGASKIRKKLNYDPAVFLVTVRYLVPQDIAWPGPGKHFRALRPAVEVEQFSSENH